MYKRANIGVWFHKLPREQLPERFGQLICAGVKPNGQRCTHRVNPATGFCAKHDFQSNHVDKHTYTSYLSDLTAAFYSVPPEAMAANVSDSDDEAPADEDEEDVVDERDTVVAAAVHTGVTVHKQVRQGVSLEFAKTHLQHNSASIHLDRQTSRLHDVMERADKKGKTADQKRANVEDLDFSKFNTSSRLARVFAAPAGPMLAAPPRVRAHALPPPAPVQQELPPLPAPQPRMRVVDSDDEDESDEPAQHTHQHTHASTVVVEEMPAEPEPEVIVSEPEPEPEPEVQPEPEPYDTSALPPLPQLPPEPDMQEQIQALQSPEPAPAESDHEQSAAESDPRITADTQPMAADQPESPTPSVTTRSSKRKAVAAAQTGKPRRKLQKMSKSRRLSQCS